MSNPFLTFAFRSSPPNPASRTKAATTTNATKQDPHHHHQPTTTPTAPLQQQTPVVVKRRTRSRSPTPPGRSQDDDDGDSTAQAVAVVSPAPTTTTTRRASARLASSGSPNGSSSSSKGPATAAVKKRKAYASLTGPPKGLGPKLGTNPLRLILVGHNPSEHAYHTGHFYSNPSNRMWSILISTGIAPPGSTGPEADDTMPEAVGVGFCDVGSGHPGTDSSLFTSEDFQRWRGEFYERLRQHVQAASSSIGCKCGLCGAPTLVAFTGKRQFLELVNIDAAGQLRRGKAKVSSASVQLGKQPPDMLPPGWPLPVDRTEVWVLTSTSGAAPMSNADRERPYQQLAARLSQVPWPREDAVC